MVSLDMAFYVVPIISFDESHITQVIDAYKVYYKGDHSNIIQKRNLFYSLYVSAL